MITLLLLTLVIDNMFLGVIGSELVNLLILHTGDIHSQFEETRDSKDGQFVGGFARIAHIVKQRRQESIRKEIPSVLYFDTGDIYVGTSWFAVHRDKVVTAFMNHLKPDAMSLGLSEFAFGTSGLLPFLKNAKFPIVVSNLKFASNSPLKEFIRPYHIISVNNTKIGIVGYIKKSQSQISANAKDVEVLDEVEALRPVVNQLSSQGINIIIALGHSDLRVDKEVANLVEGVDVVIGGHSHTFLWNGEPPDKEIPVGGYPMVVTQANGSEVAIVHAYGYAKYIGELYLTFNATGNIVLMAGEPTFLKQGITQDQDTLNLLATFVPEVANLNATFIGTSKVLLDGTTCRKKECNFGSLVADSFVQYRARRWIEEDEHHNEKSGWTDAAIALVNAGAIRKDIRARDRDNKVYQLDIISSLPHNNLLFIVEVTGVNLLYALEHGAKKFRKTGKLSGGFLVTSGVQVVYDMGKPPGFRVESVKVRCAKCKVPKYEKLKRATLYKVLTVQYLVDGGDGHTAISKATAHEIIPLIGVMDIDAVREYFQVYKIVTKGIDGRTTIKNSDSGGTKLDFFIINVSLILIVFVNFLI